MTINRSSLQDREINKFVESPTRPGEPAVEVQNPDLSAIAANTDQLENLISTTNSLLGNISGFVDQIEGFTDGLEGLVTDSNVQLTAINQNTDGLETLIGTTNSSLSTINSSILSFNKDFFGNTVTSEIYNQVEVPFDNASWTNYVTQTTANGGTLTQAAGQVTFSSGTNINGRAAAISLDSVKYRPNHEIGFGFTWKIPTASIAGVTIRIGATDSVSAWTNGVHFRHKDGIFSLVYINNGSEIFSAQQATWIDPCLGGAGSNFKTMAGSPVALDITKDQLCRIHCGLFGHAGFTVELLAPNQQWVTIYKYSSLNTQTVPVFSNFNLSLGAEVIKSNAGAGVYTVSSACWAGWTGSAFLRLNDPISDRTLASFTRTVIEGKTTAGGGGYVPVKVNPSGAMTTDTTITDISALVGQKTMALSLPVTIASNQSPVDAGVTLGDQYSPTIPDTGTTQTTLLTDPDRQLKIRGDVLTDEGTYRDDFSGIALSPDWIQSITGGASISVASSFLTLSSGTASGNMAQALYEGDYGPISLRTNFSISQRINNQTITIGLADDPAAPFVGAYFQFDGTLNNKVTCITQSSDDPSDFETTTVTYFNGLNSSQSLEYYIEVQPDKVTFLLDGQQVAVHRTHIPAPYDIINLVFKIENSAIVTNTNVLVDFIFLINQNSIQVNNSFDGDSLPIRQKVNYVQTYAAAIPNFTYAALGTDIFTIQGSNSKVIRIKHISIDGNSQQTATRTVTLLKRSSPNTGGTSTILTATPFDSFNDLSQATVRYYTANPTTLGTLIGPIHNEKLVIAAAGANTIEDKLDYGTMGENVMQDITLRSSNEIFAVNMNGVTTANNTMNIDIVWTEE